MRKENVATYLNRNYSISLTKKGGAHPGSAPEQIPLIFPPNSSDIQLY